MTAPQTTTTAKKAPAKRTAKASVTNLDETKAAKDAAKASHPAGTEKSTLYTYRATGRAGITNTRSFDRQMAVAADVRDETHTSARWKQGVITRFFATTELAERYAAKQRADGCDVVLVDAELVETKEA